MAANVAEMSAEEFSQHIASLSDEELMDQWTSFGEAVAEGRRRLREFSAEHQKRVRTQQLRDMGLTQADLDLLQSVDPAPIESAEAVGADTTDDAQGVEDGRDK